MKFTQGNIRFSDSDFRMTLECFAAGEDGVDPERAKWEKYSFRFGLSDSDFGRTFISAGKEWTIVGLNPKAKRGGYPIHAKNARGTVYKFPVSVLRS